MKVKENTMDDPDEQEILARIEEDGELPVDVLGELRHTRAFEQLIAEELIELYQGPDGDLMVCVGEAFNSGW